MDLYFVSAYLGWTLLICGFIAALPYLCSKIPALHSIDRMFKDATWFPLFQTIIGLWCLLAGVSSLIWPHAWTRTPFVANLAGAVVGIGIGLLFTMAFLKKQKNLPQDKIEMINNKLIAYQFPLGIIAMVLGFLYTFTTIGYQTPFI